MSSESIKSSNISLTKYRSLRPSFKLLIPLGLYKLINDEYEQNNKTLSVDEILKFCYYLSLKEYNHIKEYFNSQLGYLSTLEYQSIPLVKGVKDDETTFETINFDDTQKMNEINDTHEVEIFKAIEQHIKENKKGDVNENDR